MKPSRVVALVLGCLLVIPGVAILASGGALAVGWAARGDDDYFDVTIDEIESSTVAVTAEQIDFTTEPGSPQWVFDALDTDIRLRVTSADSGRPIFVGIAEERDLDAYLTGVAHDEIRRLDDRTPIYRTRTGSDSVAAPTEQTFWEESATGTGTQEVVWRAQSGRWAVVVMNADGAPVVATDVNVGVRSGIIAPIAVGLLVLGTILTLAAVGLIVFGGRSMVSPAEQPVPAPATLGHGAAGPYPLSLEAELDPALSRWQWLVKWILAIPHMIVLFFLMIAFAVLTIAAGFSILFTGRYPRPIFEFNVGVLRWGWRVSYYAFSGGLGTDRYPPFSLGDDADYPASLDVAYPERLSRGLVLVKWWLLALPHYMIIAVFSGAAFQWQSSDDGLGWGAGSGGLNGLLTLIAAIILLVTASYPRPLFGLIVGLNRWVYRVVAYASLMTDDYPPFRLDQGGSEPAPVPEPQTPRSPTRTDIGETKEPNHGATEPEGDRNEWVRR